MATASSEKKTVKKTRHKSAPKKTEQKREKRISVWFLIPAAAALMLYLLLPLMPGVAESLFSRFIFVGLSAVLKLLNGIIPVSVTEYALILLPIVLVVLIVVCVKRVRAKKTTAEHVIRRAVRTTAWILSCGALLYMLMHGANFYRWKIDESTSITAVTNDTEQLVSVTRLLAASADEARKSVITDENGNMILNGSLYDKLAAVNDGYDVVRENVIPFIGHGATRAKPVLLSYLWSYTGITGMYDPLLCEANVNVYMPDNAIPFTAAHEIAHTMGWAREDECNFLAFLCCIYHPDADFRYSGYLNAYIYCSNELASADPEAWYEIRSSLSDGVKHDLDERAEYWAQFRGKTMEISEAVNDAFLTVQGTPDGTKSYDRVVGLILGYYNPQS